MESRSPSLAADSAGAEYPLTRSQLMMWTGQNLQPSDPLYNMVLTFRLRGSIDESAFCAAFRKLVANSDSLRTVFVIRSGTPRQCVLPSTTYDIPVVELDASELDAWVAERAERILDLTECPYDTALIKLADDDYVWFLNQHHLVTDAWSASLIFGYMSEYYELAVAGRLDEAPLPPSFGDYVAYEARQRESGAMARAERYWQEALASPMAPSEFFRPTPPKRSGRTLRVPGQLGRVRSQRIREIISGSTFTALSENMAYFQLFATTLFAWLYRVTGNRLLTIGAPNHNRTTSDFRKTIGPFIEVYPLRVTIDDEETFESLYAKVASRNTELLMNAPCGASGFQHNKAYDVVLNYITASFGDFNGIPVETDWVHANHGDRHHSLRMQVEDFDNDDEFHINFDLNAEMFVGKELKKPGFQFTKLLDQFLAEPGCRLATATLLDEQEVAQIARGFNMSPAGRVTDQTVLQMFLRRSEAAPETTAIDCEGQSISYAALRSRMESFSADLQTAGVGFGDRVAIALPRSVDAVVAILATLRVGAAYIPVDPAYPAQRIQRMLEDADARLLVASSSLPADVANDIDRLHIGSSASSPAELPDIHGSANAGTAYIIFTSGSTGRPKGVAVDHRSLANYVEWAAACYTDGQPLAWPLFSSLSFDLTVTSIFVPLVSGGRIVIYPESSSRREITVRKVIEDNAVDIIKLTPAHLALLQAIDLSKSSIRKLIVGGENLKSELARSISSYYGNNVEIYNEYGPTEATVACMIHRFDPHSDTDPSVPIGHAIDNAYVYILNEAGEPQPGGVVGELYIGGAGVALGYVNRPELTADRFVDNPFRDGEKMYRSGDLARSNPDGTLTCLGRADEQFKLNGIRMEPGEIEAAMLAFPGISECAVRLIQRSSPDYEDESEFCVRCGLSGAHPDAMLDEESVCSICRVYEQEEERAHSYFRTPQDLQAIVEDAKSGSPGEQDCIMLTSGGKDSTYALCQLVELGLTPLVFTLENGYISDGAKANIRRVVEDLGLELIEGSTPAMNRIFADSLDRFSNVCNGCFKTIYTLSMKTAKERGIRYIFTGLSRGQIFETRIADMFRQRVFDPNAIDRTIIEARKAYHRERDAVYECLDTSHFEDDSIFEEIQFVDYYRYSNVSLGTMLDYLRDKVRWVRPADTGRSTNCLINEAGIYVHKKERRYHNYSLPYSWDVRLGHKERDAAREELDDDIDIDNVRRILGEIGYTPRETGSESERSSMLVGYYVASGEVDTQALATSMAAVLPSEFVPAQFIPLDALPLTPNGKLDRAALPEPELVRPELAQRYAAPETEVESKLAIIWADILGVDRVGIDDNFFELGGDSIMNIQIVAKAGKIGIRLSPQQIFDHPTVRELASAVGSTSEIFSKQGPVTGDVPLTPVQAHFLQFEPRSPEKDCQYILVRCSSPPDILAVQEAVRQVVVHHDALRAEFSNTPSGWQQTFAKPGQVETVIERMTVDAATDVESSLPQLVKQLQDELHVKGHSQFRAMIVDVTATDDTYLLLLASHLVVDAVSWWVIVEDLEQAYRSIAAGNPVRLPPKTTSMRTWSDALAAYADSEAARSTVPLWQPELSARPFILPVEEGLPGSNDISDLATIEVRADRETTRTLLTEAATNQRLQPQEILITAFSMTITEWLNRPDLVVDIESHGREPVSSDVDVLRTVGWFTSLYPVYLSLPVGSAGTDYLKAVKARLRDIPNGGVAYGALRYLGSSTEIRSSLDSAPPSPLLFNYLGQWRRNISADAWLTFARPVMASYGCDGPRRYVFEINAAVFDGELRIAWSYGKNYHHRHTVKALAERFLEHVVTLTELCTTGSGSAPVPQDFPEAELSEAELGDILAEFGED